MSHSLASPKHRIAWIFSLSAAVLAMFLLFEQVVGRLGFDFIVYYEPSSVALERRLPLEERENPEFAIRTVDDFQDLEFRAPTVLMIHGDARTEIEREYLVAEFERGTVMIFVNVRPDGVADILDPGIVSVAKVTDAFPPPFYTLVVKSAEQCPGPLEPNCGAFVVETRKFVGFAELTDRARDALDRRMRALLTPTATVVSPR